MRHAELLEKRHVKECYWNGPMRTDSAALRTIVIGRSLDDKETTIPKGWRHIYWTLVIT